jgi:hypothetical protein
LPPGAGAEFTNCGSGSFLFTTDLKKLYRKIMVTEEVFVNCYNFNPITKSQKRKCSMCLINLSGAGAEIRIWGSTEPEPKEIFSAPQHMHYCTNVDLLIAALLKPPFILVQEQTKITSFPVTASARAS